MSIPFANFNKHAQIPLTPEFIIKIKQALYESNYNRQLVVKLNDFIMADIDKGNSYSAIEGAITIFEYTLGPSGQLFRTGKVDSYLGSVLQSGTFFIDQYQGLFKSYGIVDEKVVQLEESNYVFGKLDGARKVFLEGATEETTYCNDIKNGPYNVYDKDNNLILEGHYVNDQKDGVWKLYNSNKLKKVVCYSHLVGGQYGVSIDYNEAGAIVTKSTKVLDMLHGEQFEKNDYAYYLFGEVVTKEVYATFDFTKQDAMFHMFNRSFLVAE